MELIPETTFVACQSLATLSVALNGAYFTFRLANQPGLHRIEGEFQEAVALSETTPLKDDHVVRNEFRNINARHQNFLQQYYTLYSTIDRYMIWIGYAIAKAHPVVPGSPICGMRMPRGARLRRAREGIEWLRAISVSTVPRGPKGRRTATGMPTSGSRHPKTGNPAPFQIWPATPICW